MVVNCVVVISIDIDVVDVTIVDDYNMKVVATTGGFDFYFIVANKNGIDFNTEILAFRTTKWLYFLNSNRII